MRLCGGNQLTTLTRLVFRCVLGAMSLLGWLSPGDGAELRQLEVAPHPRLGLAFPGADEHYYHLATDLGIGVIRLGVSWKHVEPEPGQFRWKSLDRRILRIQELGAMPFLTLYSDAPWGVIDDDTPVKNRRPRSISQWETFVQAVAERYDHDGQEDAPGLMAPVRYFQVANEWISDRNASGGWSGTADELIEYVDRAYAAVKAASPEAIFVMGGVAAFNADALARYFGLADYEVEQRSKDGKVHRLTQEELEAPKTRQAIENHVRRVIEGARYDVASVHLYGPEARDPVRIALIHDLSGGRPVLSSECGGPSLDYQDSFRPEEHFMAVLQRNLVVLSNDLPFCLWFRLGEGSGTFGNKHVPLYTSSGTPKPGADAYRLLGRLLQGMTSVEMLPATDAFVIRRGDAPDILVILNTGDPLPSLASIAAPNMMGVDSLEVVEITNLTEGQYQKSVAAPEAIEVSEPVVVIGERLPFD